MSIRMSHTMWGLLWHAENRLGVTKHVVYDHALPALFHTRREARAFAESKYGYIRERPDLRAEPHGWHMPQAIRVVITGIEPLAAEGEPR